MSSCPERMAWRALALMVLVCAPVFAADKYPGVGRAANAKSDARISPSEALPAGAADSGFQSADGAIMVGEVFLCGHPENF